MTERAEFEIDRAAVGTGGIFLMVLGLLVLSVPFWLPRFDIGIAVLGTGLGLAIIGLGIYTFRHRNVTGVQVVVDREGITVVAKGPDPIPWVEVERCELVVGPKGASWLRVHLRYGAPSAARLRKTSVDIHDRILTGGALGLRQAIPRGAPQAPRNW